MSFEVVRSNHSSSCFSSCCYCGSDMNQFNASGANKNLSKSVSNRHCPNCLKAVHLKRRDGFHCGGCLEPVSMSFPSDRCVINYRCTDCGASTRQSYSVNDNFQAIVEIINVQQL